MFEDIITQLDDMGVPYEEDMDTGELVIDISDIDKIQLVDIINLIDGFDYSIDENSIVLVGGEPTDMSEEESADEDVQSMALDQALGNIDTSGM